MANLNNVGFERVFIRFYTLSKAVVYMTNPNYRMLTSLYNMILYHYLELLLSIIILLNYW